MEQMLKMAPNGMYYYEPVCDEEAELEELKELARTTLKEVTEERQKRQYKRKKQ